MEPPELRRADVLLAIAAIVARLDSESIAHLDRWLAEPRGQVDIRDLLSGTAALDPEARTGLVERLRISRGPRKAGTEGQGDEGT
jgi:hypothetical protein